MLDVRRTIASLLLCFTPLAAHAVDGDFVWARSMGGTGSDVGRSVAADSFGNVYTVGSFEDEVDLDPGVDTFNVTSAGLEDIFVQKLDSSGSLVWARRMGGENLDRGEDFAVDNSGNVYITGYFSGTVDFDPGVETFNLTSAGFEDIFVQKLDAGGNLVWALRMGGLNQEVALGIAVDEFGNVYTTGIFRGTTDFDPGEDTFNLTSAGTSDIFVLKLDSSGNLAWVRRTGGELSELVNAIAVDHAGNVFTTGFFQGTVDFDPGTDTVNLTSASTNFDIFVQKLDASGNFIWARHMGGDRTQQRGNAIAVDGAGNVYTTGYFTGRVDFDPSEATLNLASKGSEDIFVQKLDNDGTFVWAQRLGSSGAERGISIAVNSIGDAHLTGYFEGTVDFDPSAATFNLASNGGEDIFVQKLDANGNFVWARQMGGMGSDRGLAIALVANGDVLTSGYYADNVDFNPRAGVLNLTSAGNSDIFVQKLGADMEPPNAIAIETEIESPTNATIVEFTVTFDEEVRLFDDVDDLLINQSGTTNTGTTISGGPSVFTVTVSGIEGDGSLTLAVDTASDVRDFAGNPLLSSVTSSALLLDTIRPIVSFGDPIGSPVNFNGTASFPITIEGASSIDLSSADVSFYRDGAVDGVVSVVNGTSATPTVQVSGVRGWTNGANYAIYIAAGIAIDAAGNFSLRAGPSSTVTVDNSPPYLTVFSPTGSPVNSSGTATFRVNVVGASSINLTSTDVTLNHNGTAGGSVVVVDGTTAESSIQITGVTGEGTYTISIAAGVASDLATNSSLAFGPSASVTVDNTRPTVTIGVPTGSPVNSSGMSAYLVSVVGASSINLTSGDVTLNHNGTAGGSVVVVDGTSATPTVQVSGVTGDGSYTVSIAAGIASDLAGNSSLATVLSAPVSVDNTAPTVSIGAPSDSPLSSNGTAIYPVTVDGATSINLTRDDVTLIHTGSADGSVAVVDGTSEAPTVKVSGVSGDGSYTISIAAGIATDVVGNASLAAGPSPAVAVDNTAPTVSIGLPNGSPVNSSGTASYRVAADGASSINLVSGDVTISHSGTSGGSIIIVDGTSVAPTVEVSGVSGDGSYTINISAGIALDPVGNASLEAGPSAAVSVDNSSPVFTNLVANPAEVSVGDTVSISFDSSEPVLGEPEVKVNGNPAVRLAKADFAYEYTVQSRDVLGAATITISGADALGNVGALGDSTLLDIVRAEGEGDVEGEGEGSTEGEGVNEGTQDGEGEGIIEGAGEGEGEGENPPAGCGGCNAAGGPMEKSLGDWLAVFLGFGVLLGAHLSLRSRLEG